VSAFERIRPYDEVALAAIPHHTPAEVRARLDRSQEAYGSWRRATLDARAAHLRGVAERLESRIDDLVAIMADEMGKPVSGGRSEVEKCAWLCRWMADEGGAHLAPRAADVDEASAGIVYRPLGGVLGVMPWNYPFWQVVRYATAALLAGNTVALKHAPNVQGCAAALEDLFDPDGQGLFVNLAVPVDRLDEVLDHPHLRAACLTGSERAGRAFARETGGRLLPTVLELGGSDAGLVLHDADVAHAAETLATSRLLNTGQSCIAAKRMIVVDAVYDTFLEAFEAALKRRTVGDPHDPDTDLGPMARADLRDALHAQVQGTVRAGGRLVVGGEMPDDPGFAYPVTLVDRVPLTSAMATGEVFGPAAAVFKVRDEAEGIALANASDLGLGAAVFTTDLDRGRHIAADELEAGCCFVNSLVKSDPRVPFGGIKHSGFGRELGPEGVRSFTNVKTVWVEG
jgi:succinate-semialdehyde dehydrogenase/glutarate-semialdehyde dehydrogenase